MLSLMSTTIALGALGVLLRWGASGLPWGLLWVNAGGSLVAGVVAGYLAQNRLETLWATALLVGFCGSLTTFSGFALECVRLIQQGDFFKFAFVFTLNNAMCLLLCYAGWFVSHNF